MSYAGLFLSNASTPILAASVTSLASRMDISTAILESGEAVKLDEVAAVIRKSLELAGWRLAGADLVGDWSPVKTQGVLSTLLDRTRLDVETVDPQQAAASNEAANMRLLEYILAGAGRNGG